MKQPPRIQSYFNPNVLLQHVILSLTVTAVTLVLIQFSFDGLKGLTIDLLYRLSPKRHPNPKIEIISYDDRTQIRNPATQRIPVDELLSTLERLRESNPIAVLIVGELDPRLYNESELRQIGGALEGFLIASIAYTHEAALRNPVPISIPPRVHYLPGFISRDSQSYGADGVTRRFMIEVEGFPSAYWRLAQLLKLDSKVLESVPVERVGRSERSRQIYIDWQGPTGSYPIHSMLDLLDKRIPIERFNGKIVLIGSALTTRSASDFILTPYSRQSSATTALEGVAHGVDNLLAGEGLKKSSFIFDILLTLFLSLLTCNFILRLSPLKGVAFALAEILFLGLAGWVSLFYFHRWLNMAHPLMMIGVGYYLVIPFRLIDEYRKRWHYQEATQMMQQLELLKNNFFSLVSHDLKTPIAFIHGNTELALTEKGLDEITRERLRAILKTSEEMSEHVETVLELTRLESGKTPLQKTTRDINTLIVEVVRDKEILAQEKAIDIKTQLDPLFSIRIDVKLLRRVFVNLIENAIKYSRRNTSISIASKEQEKWIVVTIEDQGCGISEEDQKYIFDKFYRGSSELTKSSKGTGLGLYLVKYFVELHGGKIELKSAVGVGSTFTLFLPV